MLSPSSNAWICDLADAILFHRYSQAYRVLGDALSEEEYVEIVRNRILVDKQGDDGLLQIFTSSVLQRSPGEEAPFLEFIQRVCNLDDSPKKETSDLASPPRFGCGGFGIRNFLTLFLSVELKNAMQRSTSALPDSNDARLAAGTVNLLTEQLDVSSNVLADIADAAAEEAKHDLEKNMQRLAAARQRKADAQKRLCSVSADFADRVKQLEAQFPSY